MYTKIALYDMYLTRAAAALAVVCTLSVFLYGIFLLMAVTHTAGRTTAERQITNLSAGLGDMEMQYLVAQKSVTPDRAVALGFVVPLHVSTVYVATDAQTLTLNANR